MYLDYYFLTSSILLMKSFNQAFKYFPAILYNNKKFSNYKIKQFFPIGDGLKLY